MMDFLKEWEEKLHVKITCSQVHCAPACGPLSLICRRSAAYRNGAAYYDRRTQHPCSCTSLVCRWRHRRTSQWEQPAHWVWHEIFWTMAPATRSLCSTGATTPKAVTYVAMRTSALQCSIWLSHCSCMITNSRSHASVHAATSSASFHSKRCWRSTRSEGQRARCWSQR